VVAGHIVMPALARTGAEILPVDSEHNAIFQCLEGNSSSDIEEIILTASGGPFRNFSAGQLAGVTIDQALAHPNWEMGRKISIDSATLMNKGLELIEAAWLFNQPKERLSAVIHPQSVVHGLVRFCDGSLLAQLGPADMKVPLSHALGWPSRHRWPAERLDLAMLGQLDFRPIDRQAFPCFDLACQVIGAPPAYAVMLNAANEEAVAAFLDGRLAFVDIAAVIRAVMEQATSHDCAELVAITEMDSHSRLLAANLIARKGN
jgi:1-deoxy-D-xylulose-5-phosphate reductoisomerase